jgi:HEPN domain-containing protein/predicted nucleotidyltransferase
MKTSLSHLPQYKQAELNLLTRIIRDRFPEVEMILLFGSYARDSWVEDSYVEDKVIYEYQSDYDILLICADQKTASKARKQTLLETAIGNQKQIKTPVNLIYHGIDHVNTSITQGHYFFVDIRKEGIVLYDSQKFTLAQVQEISNAQKKKNAQEDFDQWFESAKEFYAAFEFHAERQRYNEAAFQLHQAAERFYHAIILVFTGHKPKMHNLETLNKRAASLDGRFLSVFPRATEEQDRLFKLLKRAYVDARYKKNYQITAEELQTLAERVKVLQQLTQEICTEKIKSFDQ